MVVKIKSNALAVGFHGAFDTICPTRAHQCLPLKGGIDLSARVEDSWDFRRARTFADASPDDTSPAASRRGYGAHKILASRAERHDHDDENGNRSRPPAAGANVAISPPLHTYYDACRPAAADGLAYVCLRVVDKRWRRNGARTCFYAHRSRDT